MLQDNLLTKDEILKFWDECSTTKYLFVKTNTFNKPINKIYLNSLIKHTSWMNEKCSASERIYCLKNNITEYPKCKICGKILVNIPCNGDCPRFCSIKCFANSDEVRNKTKNTIKELYGDNPPFGFGSKQFKDKIKELYGDGIENISQVQEIKDKKIETLIKHYGSLENANKIRQQTLLKHHGVENTSQLPGVGDKISKTKLNKTKEEKELIQQKCKETSMKKFGTEIPMQNDEVFDKSIKSRFKFKNYIFPSGKIIKVQGFEDRAINNLLSNGINEEDIIVDRLEMKQYTRQIFYINKFGKKSRYYPDIYIKSKNLIIEVKSAFTFKGGLDKTGCYENLLKANACTNKGFNFEFMIL